MQMALVSRRARLVAAVVAAVAAVAMLRRLRRFLVAVLPPQDLVLPCGGGGGGGAFLKFPRRPQCNSNCISCLMSCDEPRWDGVHRD